MKKFIYLYISGGIDSFLSLIILKILKYNIICVNILNWINNNKKKIIEILYRISKILNIKIIVINLKNFYKKKIFFKFLKNYNNNKIINPDIYCNKIIKFKYLINYLKIKSKIISGHYSINNLNIKVSKDKNKDQSYFLYKIISNKKIIFLLGKFYKKSLKKIFFKINDFIINYKSSKGICFFENKNLNSFIFFYIYKKIKILIKNKKNLKLNLNINNLKNKFGSIIFLNKIKKSFKNKKYLKCKIGNQKYFLNCFFIKINKNKLILKIKNIKQITPGQDVSIYYKNKGVGGGRITTSFFA